MFEDKTLTCKDCGNDFVFTAGEQEFYAEKGFVNEPQRCKDCRTRLEQGEAQGSALKNSGLLPAASCHLLELGLKSGSGERSMEKIAGDMAENSEAALEEAVSRVEPALVLVCSALVGIILLSVMLPLMHIISAIG